MKVQGNGGQETPYDIKNYDVEFGGGGSRRAGIGLGT